MALHFGRCDIKCLFCPTAEEGRKDKWFIQDAGAGFIYEQGLCAGSSLGHSPADDYIRRRGQRRCNLAIVLTCCYLGVKCVITCGKCIFPGGGSETTRAEARGRWRVTASVGKHRGSFRREEAQGRGP